MLALGISCFPDLAAAAGDPVPAQEDLRYDGRPFDYWRNYLRTELKTEVPALARMRLQERREYDIQSLGADARTLVPLIAEGLKDNDAEVKIRACNWLGELKHQAEAAVPALLQEFKNQEPKVRSAAIEALGLIGDQDQRIVAPLSQLFADSKEPESLRLQAAGVLQQMGPKAKSAVVELFAVLADEEQASDTRTAAIQALGRIGIEPRKLRPVLIKIVDEEMLSNPGYDSIADGLPAKAILSLTSVGSEAKEAIPVLIRVLKQYQRDRTHRQLVAAALGRMGAAAAPALPVLREAAKSQDAGLRRAATKAIEEITGKEKQKQ
jgi:HEAT repeat protein